MKTSEIEVGKTYKGKTNSPNRTVSAEGTDFELTGWGGADDKDWISYVNGRGFGEKKHCTRKAFASWAKEEVQA